MAPNTDWIQSLKVAELKDELKKRGQPINGKKSDLAERLEAFINKNEVRHHLSIPILYIPISRSAVDDPPILLPPPPPSPFIITGYQGTHTPIPFKRGRTTTRGATKSSRTRRRTTTTNGA
jgi:hypothetical protein